MNEFFDIPVAASLSADIGSYTSAFFLPFLGPTLWIAGVIIAGTLVIFLRKTIVNGIKKLARTR